MVRECYFATIPEVQFKVNFKVTALEDAPLEGQRFVWIIIFFLQATNRPNFFSPPHLLLILLQANLPNLILSLISEMQLILSFKNDYVCLPLLFLINVHSMFLALYLQIKKTLFLQLPRSQGQHSQWQAMFNLSSMHRFKWFLITYFLPI